MRGEGKKAVKVLRAGSMCSEMLHTKDPKAEEARQGGEVTEEIKGELGWAGGRGKRREGFREE